MSDNGLMSLEEINGALKLLNETFPGVDSHSLGNLQFMESSTVSIDTSETSTETNDDFEDLIQFDQPSTSSAHALQLSLPNPDVLTASTSQDDHQQEVPPSNVVDNEDPVSDEEAKKRQARNNSVKKSRDKKRREEEKLAEDFVLLQKECGVLKKENQRLAKYAETLERKKRVLEDTLKVAGDNIKRLRTELDGTNEWCDYLTVMLRDYQRNQFN